MDKYSENAKNKTRECLMRWILGHKCSLSTLSEGISAPKFY